MFLVGLVASLGVPAAVLRASNAEAQQSSEAPQPASRLPKKKKKKEGSPDRRSANAQHIGNTEGTVAKYLRAPPQRGRFTQRWDPLALLSIVPVLGDLSRLCGHCVLTPRKK